MYEIYCKLRDRAGLTDYAVSRQTGVGRSTFSDWKTGRSAPKQDKLQKIADFFDVSVDYLTTGVENDTFISDREKRLLAYYRALSDLDRDAIDRHAQVLSESSEKEHSA